MIYLCRCLVWLCALALAKVAIDAAELPLDGDWCGAREGGGGPVTVSVVEKAIGESAGVRVDIPKVAGSKSPYASVSFTPSSPLDIDGFKGFSFFVKSNPSLKISIKLEFKGGSLHTGWSKGEAGAVVEKMEFPRDAFIVKGTPDLAELTSMSIGFGLWAIDSSKDDATLTMAKLDFRTVKDAYVIPAPTAGISIDGLYKDWGFEDNLYNWTPPEPIPLESPSMVVEGRERWSGPERLSGKFSFMVDDKNLYFLGLVVDAAPFAGANPGEPWANDSIELFLGIGCSERDIRHGVGMREKGAQIIFDCGQAKGRTALIRKGEKADPAAVSTALVPTTWIIGGKQSAGYVLEAAIPLASLGVDTFERGALLYYTIKLNDAAKIALLASPSNRSPHSDIKDFSKAYVHLFAEKSEEIKFGPVAANVRWPKRHAADAENRVWDAENSLTTRPSEAETRVYLHSLWAVQPVADASASPDPGKWSYVPTPMGIGWHMPLFQPLNDKPEDLGPERVATEVLDLKHTFFWYERTFTIDPTLAAPVAFLVFEHVDKEATVFLNQAVVGVVSQDNPRVDVSGKLRYGEPNRLDLAVFTKVRPGASAYNGNCAITGDVYVELRRQPPVIDDMWIKQADGLDGSFKIEVDLRHQGLANAIFTLDILDRDNVSVMQLEGKSAGRQALFTGTCAAFAPWSPESPSLYTAKVTCRDAAGNLLDQVDRRFGFRTFEIKDARFMLNGKILRLRAIGPTNESGVLAPGRLAKLKEYGHNCIYFHAVDVGYSAPFLDRLDEAGFVTFVPFDKAWPDPITALAIKRYRNHPSVIGYVSDPFGQLDVNGFIHNPFQTNDDYYPDSAAAVDLYKFLCRRSDFFRSIDPTRPYIPQGTGNFAAAFTNTHFYPCYDVNLVDRLAYHWPWSQRPNPMFPKHIYECGVYALGFTDTTHPEDKFIVNGKTLVQRSITYESASRYLGERAFDAWREWDALCMRAGVRGMRMCGIDGFTPWVDGDKFLDPANTVKAEDIKDHRQLSYRYFIKPYREVIEDGWMRTNSWYYSLRAQAFWPWPERYGQGPVTEKPGVFTPIYRNEMQPFTAFIEGPESAPFSMSNNYFSGETIEKRIIAVNDTEKKVDVKFFVTLAVGGVTLEKVTEAALAPGEIRSFPVSFDSPAGITEKTNGCLALEFTAPDGRPRTDSLGIVLFPRFFPQEPKGIEGLGVVQAETMGLMARMGVKGEIVTLDKEVPAQVRILVVERNALAKDVSSDALRNFVEAGGRLLVMEQTDKGLFDWRMRERRLEAVFAAAPAHPVLNGLEDADLRFFRGKAESVADEVRPGKAYRNGMGPAMETPHLTSEGIVAGFVLEKPSCGDFTPILVGGYDLEECALLELRAGKGTAIFCQVDITSRYGVDPAATLLANNLVDYLLNMPPASARAAAAYLGGEKGKAFLAELGVETVSPDAVPEGGVLLVGDGAKPSPECVKKFAAVLPIPCAEWLPAGVAASSVTISAFDYPHYWNTTSYQFDMMKSERPAPDRLGANRPDFLSGLVENDLYYFESPSLKSFSLVDAGRAEAVWTSRHATIAEVNVAGVRHILCAVDPAALKSGECSRKAWRVWSVILANLGVRNSLAPTWMSPPLDLSLGEWTLLTDPDGKGDAIGFQNGEFGGRQPRPIELGKIWEEQGVTEPNPNVASGPDSAYDGMAWYFRTFTSPPDVAGKKLFLHVDGIRDISSYRRTDNQTDLWINGEKMPAPVKIYNAHIGGKGGRLWEIPAGVLKPGRQTLLAIRIFNDKGAGGIFRKPVRFEVEGRNPEMLAPYRFVESKFNPYYFWCW